MVRVLLVVACVCLCARGTAAEYDLTVGSPAPAFSPVAFVRGAEKIGLESGHRYVIEFSGTNCAPCIKAIPTIEEVKQKYKDVTFITVFSEGEDDVRKFLNGLGATMTTLVACDVHGTISRDWMEAAGRRGIPSIFVVNENSRIVWMGSPEKLDAVLAAISRDGSPNKEQLLIAKLEQHAAARDRAATERQDEAEGHLHNVIFKLISQGQHTAAVQALDQAMDTYRDLPGFVNELRTMKFLELAYVPGSRDVAYSLALDIAADGYNQGESDSASALLLHYQQALPENKNKDLGY